MILEAGREAAEALMVDACSIVRPASGTQTYDPDTDTFTEPETSTVYTGSCRVRLNQAGTEVSAGDDTLTQSGYIVSVPASTTTLVIGDVVVISSAASDASLVGMRLRVASIERGTNVTARRLMCEVLS